MKIGDSVRINASATQRGVRAEHVGEVGKVMDVYFYGVHQIKMSDGTDYVLPSDMFDAVDNFVPSPGPTL
jgi:hypothetical protein